ncbi:MAG: hypothetical protein ACTSQJ_04605 [Promethearchaeota archaeon]
MLTKKKRVLVALFVLAGLNIALIVVVGARFLNINAQDPLFFEKEGIFVTYNFNNGTKEGTLKFEVTKVDDDNAIVKYSFKGNSLSFSVTTDGFIINQTTGKETDYQNIFWIHIVEEGSMGSETQKYIGERYLIFDAIGILGGINKVYTLEIIDYTNYWPLEPGIQGAQASMKFIIYDDDDLYIAEGLMDRTCGLIFQLKIGAGNYRTMDIVNTNYEIGRNRIIGGITILIVAFILPLVAYFLMKKLKIMQVNNDEDRLEMTILIIVGIWAIVVDIFVDIWFYAILGAIGCLILHAIMTGIFALVCIWQRYGLRCIIPSICEFLFLGGFLYVDMYLLGPYLVGFMGLLMTFMCMLFASGYEKPKPAYSFKRK